MSRRTPETRHHAFVLGAPDGVWTDGRGFAAWCAEHPGARCTLWLAGSLSRPLLADPAARFREAPALAAWARRVLADYEEAPTGAAAAVAVWRSGARSGACVLDAGVDLAACQAVARQHGVRITGVHPLWAGALALLEGDARARESLGGTGTLLVVDGAEVSVLRWRGGALSDVQNRWLASADAADLDALVVEVTAGDDPATAVFAIGHGLTGRPSARLHVVGSLDQDAAALLTRLPRRLPAPDFARLPPTALRPWMQRALAATGVAVLALALHDAASVRAGGAEAIDTADAALLVRPPAGAVRTAEAGSAARVDELVRLQHPWPQLFAAVEGTVLDGEWLVLEHRAQQPTFRLAGWAASSAQAMATARSLAASSGIADALVSRAEPGVEGGVAFEIAGRLEAQGAAAGERR